MSPPPPACPAEIAPLGAAAPRPWQGLSARLPRWRDLPWPALLAWGLCVVLALGVCASAGRPLVWAWTLTVLAPLCEEALLRGVVHESLLRRWPSEGAPRWRRAAINLLVATLFAAAHALARSLALGPAVLPVALFIGWCYQQRRRVSEAIALHAFFNLFWLTAAPLLMLLMHRGPPH